MKVSSSRLEWVFLSIIVVSQPSLLVRKLNRATGLGRLALMLSAEGFQVEANVSWPTTCVRPIYLWSPRRGMCSPKTNFHRSPRMLLACFSPLLTISWTEHQKNRWCSFPWRTSSRRIMVGGPLRIWTEVVFTPSKWDFLDFFLDPFEVMHSNTLRSVCQALHLRTLWTSWSQTKPGANAGCFFLLLKNIFQQVCILYRVFALSFFTRFFFWHVAEWRPARPPLRIVPGDFIKTYQACENIVLDLTGDFWRFSPTRNTSETKAAWKSTQFIEFTMEFTQQFNRKFWIQQFECKLIIKSFVGKLKIT